MRPPHLLAAIVMTAVLGLGWVVAKDALDHFPPILLASFRFAVTAIVLIGFFPRPLRRLDQLFITSVLAVSIPYSMSYVAMRELDVSTAVLLSQMETPTLILAGALLLHEFPTRRELVGLTIAIGGVVLVAGDPKLGGQSSAVALALGSIATWAVGQIRIRRLGKDGGMAMLAWLSLLAAPQLLFASFMLERSQSLAIMTAGLIDWLSVVYLGVVMTAVGIGIWYYLIGRYEVARVSPFLLLVPFVSIAGGVIFLGEKLDWPQVAGGALIMVGVVIVIARRFLPADEQVFEGVRREGEPDDLSR